MTSEAAKRLAVAISRSGRDIRTSDALITRRLGKVTAYDSVTKTLTATIGPSSTEVPGIHYLASYRPHVDDLVWVDCKGADRLVIGTTASWAEGAGTAYPGDWENITLTTDAWRDVLNTDGMDWSTIPIAVRPDSPGVARIHGYITNEGMSDYTNGIFGVLPSDYWPTDPYSSLIMDATLFGGSTGPAFAVANTDGNLFLSGPLVSGGTISSTLWYSIDFTYPADV